MVSPLDAPAQTRINELVAQAEQLSQRGQSDAALSCWRQVLALQPGHALASNHLGAHAMARGDSAAAKQFFEDAIAADPALAIAHANLSRLHSAQGDAGAALEQIGLAIRADPMAWGAHMERARLLQAAGRTREAAMSWSNALSYMPEPVSRAPHMQPWIEQARAAIRENQEQLHAHLHERMRPLMGGSERRELQRFEHCLDIVTGRRPFVTARPLMLPFPRLPAIPFFERDDYPWVAEVEAAVPAMLEALQGVLASQQAFEPYVKTTPGEPPAQFAALDNNLDWGAYFLWKDGQRIDAHADRCPRTEAALARAPQNMVPGRAPVAFFSALKPGIHIPPHNGATNTRLTVHMPLIIPPDCALRVGDETRVWEPGKLLMFDDTIRHEAWNFSDRLRVVLIFDVWHPMLTELERELVSQTVQGMLAYYGTGADLGEL
jgi:aspartyl/asparaginyl beta-hydroxylase (cupin superfamily)